jgi:hypothetical protein
MSNILKSILVAAVIIGGWIVAMKLEHRNAVRKANAAWAGCLSTAEKDMEIVVHDEAMLQRAKAVADKAQDVIRRDETKNSSSPETAEPPGQGAYDVSFFDALGSLLPPKDGGAFFKEIADMLRPREMDPNSDLKDRLDQMDEQLHAEDQKDKKTRSTTNP